MSYISSFSCFSFPKKKLKIKHEFNFCCYDFIGLANKNTVTIQPGGKDQSVLLATSKTKKQNKPSSLLNKSVMKEEFRRMAKAVSNQVIDQSNVCIYMYLFGFKLDFGYIIMAKVYVALFISASFIRPAIWHGILLPYAIVYVG